MSFLQSQFRRGTAAEWTSANPVLLDGELGWEKDTKKFKIGDGVTAWNALAYGGIQGPASTTPGPAGDKGWSPILATVADGERRVLQITDWTGGAGTKPSTTNQFLGPTGIVSTAAAAVDIRGAQGAAGSAPANALTTDTPQTLTTAGVKQFPPNTLLMRSTDGTQTAEPYSDVNPPSSLEMTLAASPATPTTGEATLYTLDGVSLSMRSSAGTTTTIGPSAGGASGAALEATTDYADTTPTNPANGLKVFSRHRARRLPAFLGPLGQDSQLQPALFSNRVARVNALNAAAAMIGDGFPAPTAYTTASVGVALASTNFYTSMSRTRFASAATAAAFAGFRIPNNQFFLSSTANMGGFFMVMRFGINLGTPTARGFVGMTAATANEANADPTTLLNRIGFGFNATSTNWYFHSAGAAANATTVDLGANFPVRTYATNFFEFRIFAPSALGQTVYWSAQRLNDGVVVQGGPVTTNLPAIGTMLGPHMWMNNQTAVAVSMDVQSLYVETDN